MIGYTQSGGVVTIELQRPQQRNALNLELIEALRDAMDKAAADEARAIVLTGQGKAFCAGADLSEVYTESFTDALVEMLETIDSIGAPVISAVNGPAIGAGTQLALASDLRVVAPDAYFAIPAARLGITVNRWTVHRLAELAGGGRARSILLGVESLPADDALACGLANRIGSLADAQDWAADIATLAPLTLQHLKLVFNEGASADETHEQRAAMLAAWLSEDAKEGRRARAEKRKPLFAGR
ncbi:enoyl-CoA hydratase [Skermania sp. ID1734]|uniref:enoyl-CoA hydratase n=1 Tax=Skermania sp. ID1734 TaxID=2597516 RepID=UPI00117DDC73|nr:enoyl-CoA hydratase [Skermania sp. ID1734]TSD96648.1 enoyl-CoA hydratase [Skermania sp. ID1734]